ncbi:MAG: hypothetical protein IPH57_04330 [Saprospiraceae bacterium]|nr:hypothetical protein [Saprospiraceae bacterium]
MIEWLFNNPFIFGLITFVLMCIDWGLTILQESERKEHYFSHYQSYPINTIEGSPAFQSAVAKRRLINPKHFIASVIIGTTVSFALLLIPRGFSALFIGYIWGLFIIVCTQHLNNLFGYIASRKGLHGKLYLHQRTAYLIQSGRYFSIAILLLILSILSGSELIYGVTIAGFTSAFRQIVWLRKVPLIDKNDLPPDLEISKNEN